MQLWHIIIHCVVHQSDCHNAQQRARTLLMLNSTERDCRGTSHFEEKSLSQSRHKFAAHCGNDLETQARGSSTESQQPQNKKSRHICKFSWEAVGIQYVKYSVNIIQPHLLVLGKVIWTTTRSNVQTVSGRHNTLLKKKVNGRSCKVKSNVRVKFNITQEEHEEIRH